MKFRPAVCVVAFATQSVSAFTTNSSLHVRNLKYSAWRGTVAFRSYADRASTATALSKYNKDTLVDLPSFETKEEYTDYLMEASALPKGFSTGSAIGSFVPEEAPAMGSLPIKGTIIHLTDGPSDSWAAVFTQNKVSFMRHAVRVYCIVYYAIYAMYFALHLFPLSNQTCHSFSNSTIVPWISNPCRPF